MNTPVSTTISSGGLVTVAFLKARIDEGADHIGMFTPLVIDVLHRVPTQSFTTGDVQELISQHHQVAIPLQTVATLLNRQKKTHLIRDSGRYSINPNRPLPASAIEADKQTIERSQVRLAESLIRHARRRGVDVGTATEALDRLVAFVEAEQVGLLLGEELASPGDRAPSRRETIVIAEFLQDLVHTDDPQESVLRRLLEGLVLYHAAFLPDLSSVKRRIRTLKVVFDSTLVRQALGYEGSAQRDLAIETIDLFKSCGAQCIVFDITTGEITRILAMYEKRLGTDKGRRSLRPVPMARHFLTSRYSPGDVREMIALLDRHIRDLGFQISTRPERKNKLTAGEAALAKRLADKDTGDELEPRVVHDVDCVAGVLTLRQGHRTNSIEESRSVFVTDAPLVIRNVRRWWREDEHETCLEPVLHVRALTNALWLKNPAANSKLKTRELIALCGSALRPEQRTWDRFMKHLEKLSARKALTVGEFSAIIASATTDLALMDSELEAQDPLDNDATTLDEVVERVKATYRADVDERLRLIAADYERKLKAAAAFAVSESTLSRDRLIVARSERWARNVARTLNGILVVVLVVAAVALITEHPIHEGRLAELAIVAAVGIFVVLEAIGIFNHASEVTRRFESWLTEGFSRWLAGK